MPAEAQSSRGPELAAIREAQRFLAGYFGATRLIEAPYLSGKTGKQVWLQLEAELPTGSFKVRGALGGLATRMRAQEQEGTMYRAPTGTETSEASAPDSGAIKEVIACSTGNHGAAVAWAGKLLGVKARIFLPTGVQSGEAGKDCFLAGGDCGVWRDGFGGGV